MLPQVCKYKKVVIPNYFPFLRLIGYFRGFDWIASRSGKRVQSEGFMQISPLKQSKDLLQDYKVSQYRGLLSTFWRFPFLPVPWLTTQLDITQRTWWEAIIHGAAKHHGLAQHIRCSDRYSAQKYCQGIFSSSQFQVQFWLSCIIDSFAEGK